MHQKKLGNIVFVVDERLSRERSAILSRVINSTRQIAHVELISGGIKEDELLKKLEGKDFQLVIVPWYRYLAWSRVEAFYGLTRTSGPTFVGYFSEQLMPYELGEQADHLRAILLDFCNLNVAEISTILRNLIQDSRRAGIRPFFETSTPIYCESWYGAQGLGLRLDNVLTLPEIANSEWVRRASSVRIALTALWSLVYEEGPGKSELNQAITSKQPKAYFQLGVDGMTLVLRLCYTMPNWTPKDALAMFWPNPKKPSAPPQLLLRYADFLRVHTIPESSDIEVVAGFFNSQPSEEAYTQVHTLWIEPITANLVTEVPYEVPNPNARHLKPLPAIQLGDARPRLEDEPAQAKAKDRFIFEAAVKLRELKQLLGDKEQLIKELRSGGVGTAPPLPPPDAESLLEAFQERFFEARFQIRQFELQIEEMERKGATRHEVEAVRQKMAILANREQAWIRKIAATLESYRDAKRKA